MGPAAAPRGRATPRAVLARCGASPSRFSSDHKAELSVLAALSLAVLFALVQRRCSRASKIAMALGLLGVYCYRAALGNVLLPWRRGSKDISK